SSRIHLYTVVGFFCGLVVASEDAHGSHRALGGFAGNLSWGERLCLYATTQLRGVAPVWKCSRILCCRVRLVWRRSAVGRLAASRRGSGTGSFTHTHLTGAPVTKHLGRSPFGCRRRSEYQR